MKAVLAAIFLMIMGSSLAHATTYPKCTGTGQVAGDAQSTYWSLDGQCNGFDFFARFGADFPAVVNPCPGSVDKRKECIDLAYAKAGRLTWLNVKVPNTGRYQLDFRYSFAKGLFPALVYCQRPEALLVNGVTVIDTIHFMRTSAADFSQFRHEFVTVELKAGVNNVALYNNGSDHGISRVDSMKVSPTSNGLTSIDGGPVPNCMFP